MYRFEALQLKKQYFICMPPVFLLALALYRLSTTELMSIVCVAVLDEHCADDVECVCFWLQ